MDMSSKVIRVTQLLGCPYRRMNIQFETSSMRLGKRMHRLVEEYLKLLGFVTEPEVTVHVYRGWRLVAHPDAVKDMTDKVILVEYKSHEKCYIDVIYQTCVYKAILEKVYKKPTYAIIVFRSHDGNNYCLIDSSLDNCIDLEICNASIRLVLPSTGLYELIIWKFVSTVDYVEKHGEPPRIPEQFCYCCHLRDNCDVYRRVMDRYRQSISQVLDKYLKSR